MLHILKLYSGKAQASLGAWWEKGERQEAGLLV